MNDAHNYFIAVQTLAIPANLLKRKHKTCKSMTYRVECVWDSSCPVCLIDLCHAISKSLNPVWASAYNCDPYNERQLLLNRKHLIICDRWPKRVRKRLTCPQKRQVFSCIIILCIFIASAQNMSIMNYFIDPWKTTILAIEYCSV